MYDCVNYERTGNNYENQCYLSIFGSESEMDYKKPISFFYHTKINGKCKKMGALLNINWINQDSS